MKWYLRFTLSLLLPLFCAACAGSPAAKGGETGPAWANDSRALDSLYPPERYIAVVGYGTSRADAEKKALAKLVEHFEVSVRSDSNYASWYAETNSGAKTVSQETVLMQNQIVTAASFDKLTGAEIGQVWAGQGSAAAAAFMEKKKTVAAYTELINANLRNIAQLTGAGGGERNSLEGYARWREAAVLAAQNLKYAAVVSLAGGPPASSFKLESPQFYIAEAGGITRNIPVAVNVSVVSGRELSRTAREERARRVRDAFAAALSGQGLLTEGQNPPYVITVNVQLSEAVFPNAPFKFCRYSLSAALSEVKTRAELLPFSLADREGHSSYEGAEEAALLYMTKAVNEQYGPALEKYLAELLSRQR